MDSASATPEHITYLIANYNQRAYVADCIDSLRAQQCDRWRAVIVDDASTDDSVAVIEALHESRIRLLRNRENIGKTGTLMCCLEEAATDLVAVLDPDDTLTPDATTRLLKAYEEDSAAAFVFSRFALRDSTMTSVSKIVGRPVPAGGTCLWHGHVGHILSFRRSAYRRTAGLDESMLYAEDRDLVYKLEEVTRPVFVDAVLYNYRFVSHSQSHDPQKREIGARNTLRARRAALRRRGVRGLSRLLWEIVFLADYLAYSARTPDPLRHVAGGIAGRAARLAPDPSPRQGLHGAAVPIV